MLTACSDALKEWAVVCAALASGRQTLLLRKGGIAEGPSGFTVQHPEFWLYPTRFHQSAEELVADAAPLLEHVGRFHPADGRVRFSLYATVVSVHHLTAKSQLDRLDGMHVLSRDTIYSRFSYRQPGLYALVLRVFTMSPPHEIAESPDFAGCHSWVGLKEPLSTEGIRPVLSEMEFADRLSAIEERLPT